LIVRGFKRPVGIRHASNRRCATFRDFQILFFFSPFPLVRFRTSDGAAASGGRDERCPIHLHRSMRIGSERWHHGNHACPRKTAVRLRLRLMLITANALITFSIRSTLYLTPPTRILPYRRFRLQPHSPSHNVVVLLLSISLSPFSIIFDPFCFPIKIILQNDDVHETHDGCLPVSITHDGRRLWSRTDIFFLLHGVPSICNDRLTGSGRGRTSIYTA
jgi:hypothetical protein